jgi:predicted phosphodiesterase
MRIALIADIHGNLAALEAVLADLAHESPDQIVCLGDVAATGPQPREVLNRMRALGGPVVQGNTDAFLLGRQSSPDDDEATRRFDEIDRWCAAQLAPEDLAYLRTFRPTVELPLGDGTRLLCYHGSPRSYDDVISATTPEAELAPMLAGARATVMAGGHWHFQMLRRFEDVILLNPGSVGLAYDILPDGARRVPPRAEYALITAEDGRMEIDFRRVPYDRDATRREIFARGLPYAEWWTSDWR